MVRRISRFAILGCTVVLVAGCASSRGTAGKAPRSQATRESVQAVQAVNSAIQPFIVLPGAIAPRRVVALSNSLNEPAGDVFVEEGEHVAAGQRLAQLNVDDLQANLSAAEHTASAQSAQRNQQSYSAGLALSQAPTQVQQAQAQVAQAAQTLLQARNNLKRDEVLLAQGYLPAQNVDEQRVVVANDEAAVASANASLRSTLANQAATGTQSRGLQASALEVATQNAAAQRSNAVEIARQIERATITSPIEGYVVNRNLNPGEYPAGRQIFTIEQTSSVYAVLTASAIQANAMAQGNTVSLRRIGIGGQTFRGTIDAILDAAVPGATNFAVKVLVPNPQHALRPGMTINATVALTPVRGTILPVGAFTDDSRSRVVIIRNHRAHIVPVQEVATDGLRSVVRGIASGTRVAVQSATAPREGELVDDRR